MKSEVTTRGPGQPPMFQDPVAFANQVDEYFAKCAETGELVTITGLAVYLDTDRKTLYNYRSKDEFFPTIKRALTRCEQAVETLALQGKLNPAMSIFTLKNNYGWVDKSEVDQKIDVVQPILGGAAKQLPEEVED